MSEDFNHSMNSDNNFRNSQRDYSQTDLEGTLMCTEPSIFSKDETETGKSVISFHQLSSEEEKSVGVSSKSDYDSDSKDEDSEYESVHSDVSKVLDRSSFEYEISLIQKSLSIEQDCCESNSQKLASLSGISQMLSDDLQSLESSSKEDVSSINTTICAKQRAYQDTLATSTDKIRLSRYIKKVRNLITQRREAVLPSLSSCSATPKMYKAIMCLATFYSLIEGDTMDATPGKATNSSTLRGDEVILHERIILLCQNLNKEVPSEHIQAFERRVTDHTTDTNRHGVTHLWSIFTFELKTTETLNLLQMY